MPSVNQMEFDNAVQNCGYPRPTLNQYDCFSRYLSRSRISSKIETAMFLAQVMHESGGLLHKREISPHPSYGNYYGRGYIQLSTEENYRRASEYLGLGRAFVDDPDLVLEEPWAWATAFWYWDTVVHDHPGVTNGNFQASTDAINPMTPNANHRNSLYAHVRNSFGC